MPGTALLAASTAVVCGDMVDRIHGGDGDGEISFSSSPILLLCFCLCFWFPLVCCRLWVVVCVINGGRLLMVEMVFEGYGDGKREMNGDGGDFCVCFLISTFCY
ncbi:hypothetical protein A2U01_0020547 [Trifolium medium]|uniref:Uncharacterized protein n=1 Tax=Trifolium medium TaxID=97028 RepID=A0A392NJI4_9FABA|nr:hypothetical protein [Trifolium medium]